MKLAMESRAFIIIILTLVISVFHLTADGNPMSSHMIHRELFFIPIILTCFWFGLTPGLITVGIISVLYVLPSFFAPETQLLFIPALFQVLTFFLITVIVGLLVNQNEKIHEENIRKNELSALGNAALNIGTEIQDVLAALKKTYFKRTDEFPEKDEIEEGFGRLDNLVRILTSFVTHGPVQKMNIDINQLVIEQISGLEKKASSRGIRIKTTLDQKNCPSKVAGEPISKLIKDLIVNAMEASSPGGKIWVKTNPMPTYNILEVQDEGTGIKPEHLKKIFRPFFTTKESGHGLSLASDYKFIQSCGGDIKVYSQPGKGTCFKVKIPIDDLSLPINTMNRISDWNPRDSL